jgi:hypothetical protein
LPRGRDRGSGPAGQAGLSAADPGFQDEIQWALRYEKSLILKAALALALVAGIILARIYLFG